MSQSLNDSRKARRRLLNQKNQIKGQRGRLGGEPNVGEPKTTKSIVQDLTDQVEINKQQLEAEIKGVQAGVNVNSASYKELDIAVQEIAKIQQGVINTLNAQGETIKDIIMAIDLGVDEDEHETPTPPAKTSDPEDPSEDPFDENVEPAETDDIQEEVIEGKIKDTDPPIIQAAKKATTKKTSKKKTTKKKPKK